MTRPVPAARCPRCRGWVRVLDGDWLVPHFRRGSGRLCPGSSGRAPGEVRDALTGALLAAPAPRREARKEASP